MVFSGKKQANYVHKIANFNVSLKKVLIDSGLETPPTRAQGVPNSYTVIFLIKKCVDKATLMLLYLYLAHSNSLNA